MQNTDSYKLYSEQYDRKILSPDYYYRPSVFEVTTA